MHLIGQICAEFGKKLSLQTNGTTSSAESVLSQIQNFRYDTDRGIILADWFKKYEDIINIDPVDVQDEI